MHGRKIWRRYIVNFLNTSSMYLNCHSFFSFKYGAIPLEELLKLNEKEQYFIDTENEKRKETGEGRFGGKFIKNLALTDINNTSGCLDFIRLSEKYMFKPVVGIDFRNNGVDQCFIGLAKNHEGFYELNKFLSTHLERKDDFPARAPQLENTFIIYPFRNQPVFELKENEFIGVHSYDLNRFAFSEWKEIPDKCVALSTVTFRNKTDFNVHRLLRSMANNTLLSKLPKEQQARPEDTFFSPRELEAIYKEHPHLLKNSEKLLDKCDVKIEFHKSKNKQHFNKTSKEDIDQLIKLCDQGILKRYRNADDNFKKQIEERVKKELGLIEKQGFSAYFLINWEIIEYARAKNYFYVGRGSGANSIVAYLLRITDVDPIELDLYFERFINEFRVNPPDFDIDFSWTDRDDVIAHIFERHGRDHTALLGSYSTFQTKAVLRELGKVFGLPKGEIDRLELNNPRDEIGKLILKYSEAINDFPSHLSIHACGILISEKPIHYYSATSYPPKPFPVTQYSMLEAEDLGLYKFDILSQRGLGHIKDAVAIVKENQNVEIDIHDITAFKKDERIKKHLMTGRTMGCFYVESPGMRMLLKKLEAKEYLDLVAASSIIRPGVAQSGMMREYILRFRDPDRREYIHPLMKELMEETFGIMVYQEDVIKVAHHFAGLTLGEADVLRRGMSGKYRGREEFQKAKDKFINGCLKKGYGEAVTLEVWRQVESFAGYSFSKGHSASYAVESYQSLYLKAHFPLEFMVGVINNFGGFYQTEFYVHEARMAGAQIHAPCVNSSDLFTTIKGNDIYLGFGLMGELESLTAETIVRERHLNGPFKNLENFCRRSGIAIEQLRLLIKIGAFRFSGRTKKELLWDILGVMGTERKNKPEKELFEVHVKEFQLPPLIYSAYEDAMDEIDVLGFPLVSPFRLLEEGIRPNLIASNLMENENKYIEIVGYFVCHKPVRTSNKQNMFFATFLDSEGHFFDTTHFPDAAARFPLRGKGCYLIKGQVTVEFDFPSLEVSFMEKVHLRAELIE